MNYDPLSHVSSNSNVNPCYLILDQQGGIVICRPESVPKYVRWYDYREDQPIAVHTMEDGSWPIEAKTSPGPGAETFLYWLYPFDPTIHVWYLDENGVSYWRTKSKYR